MFLNLFSYIPVMDESLLNTLSISSYASVIVFFFIALFSKVSHERKEQILLGKKKAITVDSAKKRKFARKFRTDLFILLDQKGQGHMLDVATWTVFGAVIGSAVFLLLMEQPVLAVIFPFILYRFLHYVIVLMTNHVAEAIEEELPLAIDHMVRVSSKTDSLKTIFFETSKRLDGPLGAIFEDIALKLSNTDAETLLLDFGNEYNNIWIYNFTFTVINFTKHSNKASVLENLIELRNMLEEENQQKKIQKTERKYAVMLNYAVAGASFFAFILNLIFNPVAKSFFFGSVMGLGCLGIGFTALFATVLINIRLVKSSKRK